MSPAHAVPCGVDPDFHAAGAGDEVAALNAQMLALEALMKKQAGAR